MGVSQITTAVKAAIGIAAALTISLWGVKQAHAQPEVGANTIVFVCEHGSAKSVVAAAHFNRLAAQSHLNYRAVARGVTPDAAIPPAIRAGLLSDGLNPNEWVPRAITNPDIQRAAKVVTLETKLPQPAPGAKLVQWTGIPSLSENYASARTDITVRLQELIATLQATRER